MISVDKLKNEVINSTGSSSILQNDGHLASGFMERIQKWIHDFEKELDEKHEVGLILVNLGQKTTFHLESVYCWNPSLIGFSVSTVEGEPYELIQHVSQISILLQKVERKNPDKPKKQIGFYLKGYDD